MSKSLGNFVTIQVLEAYAQKFSLDALCWYMVTQGPLGATDADFGTPSSSRSTTPTWPTASATSPAAWGT